MYAPNSSARPRDEALEAVVRVAAAYEEYRDRFGELTGRAGARFARREWWELQRDAQLRLLLYDHHVGEAIRQLARVLVTPHRAADAGPAIKRVYAESCRRRADPELAKTFFNSVVRRAFHVRGVRPELEFAGDELEVPAAAEPAHRRYPVDDGVVPVRRILDELPLAGPLADPEDDARLVEAAIRHEPSLRELNALDRVDVLEPLFYRNKGAYAVGRIHGETGEQPLILALRNAERGITVDAALFTPDEASIVFGFTRSYFHVLAPRARPVVDFLHSLMPQKRLDEIYTAIGHHRHGKAELYRGLMRHLYRDEGRFERAPGEPGLVMYVFTNPTFNVVFKVIRDRFGAPKRTTRRDVMARYRFIFMRDRVGRLADAQQFEHLELRRGWFAPDVLAELEAEAGRTVRLDGDRVRIRHLYTERRVTPLDLYLRIVDEEQAIAALLDYGQAIKDLAAANIFPGDMLFKNFGVTRHGRVVFYDYDEVGLLTDFRFRPFPEPVHEEDELSDEPWFHVSPDDVFPEELARFLVPGGRRGAAFRDAHGDLFTIEFWQGMQEQHRRDALPDFFPYPEHRRLRG